MTAYQLYSMEDLKTLPEPRWLVEDIIPEDGIGVLYGPSGSGKSFAALSLALSVSEGSSWLGKAVTPGFVVVLCLEGFSRYLIRIQAACEERGIEAPRQLKVTNDPIDLNDENSVQRYIDSVNAQRGTERIALTIVDTFTSATAGGEENSNSDRSMQVNALKRMALATGNGAVLAVAHTGVNTDRVRGATVLKDLSDYFLKLDDGGEGKTLRIEKAKDAEAGQKWLVTLKKVGKSCVFLEADPADPWSHASSVTTDRQVLHALHRLHEMTDGDAGVSTKEWILASGKSSSTLHRIRERLLAQGYVKAPRRGRNVVTEKGERFLTPEGAKVLVEDASA